ncbi:hypothetical protein DFH29DRAFT_1006381 [Suillus ampliporus]|nr:hypothetical protein DFH29DRAFT_1006381 [Suillus ampliporus]
MLSQVFENESESPTSRAKYVFPLPANAAICAFELKHADGRVMTGVAKLKEKSEAAETFMLADTIAMQLSFAPKLEMPRVASQEYILVVDRSASVSGAPTETTKRTLGMLLHLLPDLDTTFNIFSEVDGDPPAVNFLPSNYHHWLPASHVVELEPLPPIQQVPHRITKIFHEMRLNVFAITTFRSIPLEVRLRAEFEGLAEVLKLVVPVTLHERSLSTWQKVEHHSQNLMAPITNEEVRKAAIVHLGLECQLASQCASFTAIESRREAVGSRLRTTTSLERSWQQHYYGSSPSVTSYAAEYYALGMDVTMVQTVLDDLSWVVDAVFSFFTPEAALTHSRRQNLLPSTYYSTAQTRSLSSQRARPFHHDNSSTDTFSILSSLEGSSINSQMTHSRSSSPLRPSEDSIQLIPSPVFDSTHNTRRRARLPRHAVVSDSHPLLMPEEVYTLILLQGYDGSFAPSPQLEALLGAEILEKAADL